MFAVMLTGTLVADPKPRTSESGNAFTTAMLRVGNDGEDGILASVIAFGSAAAQLATHRKADELAVVGTAKLSSWQREGAEKHGLSVKADSILSVYMLAKRRQEATQALSRVAPA